MFSTFVICSAFCICIWCLIILIASDLRRIFSTIVSRCQKIRFSPLDRCRAEIALKQEHHLDEQLSHYLAYAFEGRLGQALEINQEGILKEKNEIIKSFIFSPDLLSDKFDVKDKGKLSEILIILIGCARDIYLLKSGSDKRDLINQDINEELFLITKKFSFAQLDRILEQLCGCFENLRQNINPRLLVDNIGLLWKK